MLYEAIFLATFCCETSCKKDFTCNTPVLQPATATKCCVASCKKSRNILCGGHVHRNLQGNFVKIRQSEPVFCSQEISSWRRKSCKQFPPGALQVAQKYCERVTPLLQLAMFFSRHRCETSCRKIASCNMAFKGHVTRGNFSCNLSCETSCKKDFTFHV